MDGDFTKAVDDGLKLAKRVCYSKDRYSPPKPVGMDRAPSASLLPTAPMLYAVIRDPGIVDNPDVPSYQPHVHGRLDPPALIPLHMNEVGLEVDCSLDSAFVTVKGSWRLHCVMGSKSCDCRLVVPMGEEGSILGVEIDVSRRSYHTQVIQIEEHDNSYSTTNGEIGGFLKPQIFFLTVPQVDGGSNISLKISWFQKLSYSNGEFSIGVPFSFPEFVNPFGKFAKRERIKMCVKTGTGKEILLQTTSHALRETKRELGSLFFSYEADVLTWSSVDFHFSYIVYSNDLFGGIILQSPSMQDFDQRDIFSLYLFPGNTKQRKVIKNEVVFIIDTSESMRGRTIEHAASALSAAISDLSPVDTFNIIVFNDATSTFSSSLELATTEIIEKARQWISRTVVAVGGTNIVKPLNEALEMLSNAGDSAHQIIFITDGSVEDERSICSTMRKHVGKGPLAPRISTFGIGSYCNHYFLRMLARISRGQYDAALDADSVETRLQTFFKRVLSPVYVDINVDAFDDLDGLEVNPFPIPDLSLESPLFISGRYQGSFPDSIEVNGKLANSSSFVINLSVKATKGIFLDKVFLKQEIDSLTTQAWFSNSTKLEEKVIKLSKQGGFASEYTNMILHQKEEIKFDSQAEAKKHKLQKRVETNDLKVVQGAKFGFGNVAATMQNLPSGFREVKPLEPSAVIMKAVGCCSSSCDICCCRCCISVCSSINDQCAIVLTQLCTALSCLACYGCCSACCDGSE